MKIPKILFQSSILLILLYLNGCTLRSGVLISISPQNSITQDCLIEAITSLHPDIKLRNTTFSEQAKDTYANFVMSENFLNRFSDLNLPIKVFNGDLSSSLIYEKNLLKQIEIFLSYSASDLNKFSNEDKSKFANFIKPYISLLNSLPNKLEKDCSLKSEPTDVKIKCFGSVCEFL